MTFLTDVQELKTGLIIFRRADVAHKNWYCRVRVPHHKTNNRYKTISLRTPNEREARDRAFDHDADIRFRVRHNVPVFDKTVGDVCDEYLEQLRKKAEAEQITWGRYKIVEGYVRLHIKPYCGQLQVTHYTDDHWNGYPAWRKKHNAPAEAKESYGPRKRKANGVKVPAVATEPRPYAPAKNGTIRQEQATMRGVLRFAARKLYIRENQVPKGKCIEDDARREEFTPQEYRKLHTEARHRWRDKGDTEVSKWYRQMAYLFMLVMTNTGMRTIEARNLRWRNIDIRKDDYGRTFAVFFVKGKKKYRELVAAGNVVDYLERVRKIGKATAPDDYVFSNFDGRACPDNYGAYIEDMLKTTGLLTSASGSRRSAYSFRHTYATFRLMEGVDVYFLAKQMGTSVQMIEKHYGHITPAKNAARILQGISGWEPFARDSDGEASRVNAEAAGSESRKPRKK